MFIDFTNYEDYPIGGYLSFAKNMIDAFGSQLALVGISTNPDEPVGQWFKKNIGGIEFDFFALARYKKSKTKHIIPDRLATYFLIKLYNRRINQIEIKNVFIQRQEILLALRTLSNSICFSFAGMENPLSISKYWYGKLLARYFERYFFKELSIAKVILARGDDASIDGLIRRSGGTISPGTVIKFPTRINTEIFRPLSKEEARLGLSLPLTHVIVVTTGRLAEFKGWRFMIDCFTDLCATLPDSRLYFIGEGEAFNEIKAYISECNMERYVILGGKKSQQEVALYLNAADLFIMGSMKEGWSTSLMEAIACGVPSCVTDFSSAADIVIDGVNGYVVSAGDRTRFVEYMLKSLKLFRPVRNDHVVRYSTRNLKTDILKYWNLS
ncbi:MAG TPA: hypothetical protein DDW27_06055 [Bacteroidales bacterium]|nr:hypothetical protein [Bacteroidales bacterium]